MEGQVVARGWPAGRWRAKGRGLLKPVGGALTPSVCGTSIPSLVLWDQPLPTPPFSFLLDLPMVHHSLHFLNCNSSGYSHINLLLLVKYLAIIILLKLTVATKKEAELSLVLNILKSRYLKLLQG